MAKHITTRELHEEIKQVKENHLAHIHKDIDDLWVDVKDNRKYFESRLDRLDNRIWALVLLALSTLGATIASIVM
jgi:hypothetical protein